MPELSRSKKRVLNRFGDSDAKKPLPDGRGSAGPPAGLMERSVVRRAESTRLLPSRDRQGAVYPKRLSTLDTRAERGPSTHVLT